MMRNRGKAVYDPDFVVNPELARRLIVDQFPGMRTARIVAFGEGWDNWIYRADGWIFRFPRRRIAVPLAEREVLVLPHLAPRLSLPIPNPVWIGRPTPAYPWPFFGYRRLRGTPVAEMALDPDQRSSSAEPLADFLSALQSISGAEAGAWGAGEATAGRMDLGPLKVRFETWLASALDSGLVPANAPWAREFRDAETLPISLDRPVLVHGDLNFKNVLLGSDHRLAGVVDWGDVHIGHRAEDWMFAAGYLPRAGQERFRARIAASDESLWRVARAVAIYVNLIVLVSANDMGRADDMAEARWQLQNLSETEGS